MRRLQASSGESDMFVLEFSWVQKTLYLRANVPELRDPNDGSSPGEDGCGDGEKVNEEAKDTRARRAL